MTMPAMTSLDVLIESSRNALDGETRRLAEELDRCRAAEDRLQLLERYRHDYESAFREKGAAGLTVGAWRDYRLFLGQLDAAILQQKRVLEERRVHADKRRETWSAADARVRKYSKVAERRGEEAKTVAGRAEQRLLDEMSFRRAGLMAQ